MEITPSLTLKEIYGPQLVFNPRVSYSGLGWIPKDSVFDDFRTGALLSIAGDMPFVCNERTITGEALGLMEKAGITPAENLLTYECKESYYSLLDSLKTSSKKQVINHAFPDSEIPEDHYWIDQSVFSYLNNKANLQEIVPKENLPRRTVFHPDETAEIRKEWDLPFVMKAATDLPNGGGHDVVLCREERDFEEACELLKDCESIVIEELVDDRKNFCLQFAKTLDGQIHYLGAGEQIVSSEGNYEGNWITADGGPPEKAIQAGRAIMEKACQLGYKGVAGFDMLVTDDGRIVCIDLNFRLNGSTPALLLKDSIFDRRGSRQMMFRSWRINNSWDQFQADCQSMIENGTLIPVSVYHPEDPSGKKTNPFISGIMLGDSKEDIEEKENFLGKRGWN